MAVSDTIAVYLSKDAATMPRFLSIICELGHIRPTFYPKLTEDSVGGKTG